MTILPFTIVPASGSAAAGDVPDLGEHLTQLTDTVNSHTAALARIETAVYALLADISEIKARFSAGAR